jgi:hypothetical protein
MEGIKKNNIIYKCVCGLIGHQERGCLVEGQLGGYFDDLRNKMTY